MTITIHICQLGDDQMELATSHEGAEEATRKEWEHAKAILKQLPTVYEAAGVACGAGRIAVYEDDPRQ